MKKIYFYILILAIIITAFMTHIMGVNAQANGNTGSTGSYSPFKLLNGVISPQGVSWTFKLPYLGGSGTKCIQVDNNGLLAVAASACGSGGGSGGGTWATTTSTVSGRLINYPLNTTDIVVIGGTATTTGATEVWFDPNTENYKIGSSNTASTTIMGIVNLPTLSQGFAYIGSSGKVNTVASSSINLSGFTNDSGFLTSVTADSPLSGSGTSGSHLTLSTAGTWSGNAGTATALAADGSNCSAGSYPLGVDASGASQNCTVASTGTVTAVSVASANGFAGSSSGGATPALTLTTSISGILKGNGTAISAGSNGTDYTLITAKTCTLGDFVSAITAAGVFTCSTPSGSATSAFEIATTSDIALSQVVYISKTSGRTTLASAATTSLAIGASLSNSGTLGAQIGGSASTLSLNTANANTWSALQTFNYSSSTIYSSFITASSTNFVGGGLATCSGSNFLQYTASGFFGCGTPAGAGTVTSVVAGAGFQNQGLNITGSGTLVGAFASTSNPTVSNVPYVTGVGDASNPIKLGFVATTSLTASAPLALSQPISVFGSSASALTCTSASSGVTGCLTGTDWNTFNGKENVLTFTWPLVRTTNTITYAGFGTTTDTGIGNDVLLYTSHTGIVKGVASSSLSLPNTALQNSTISGVALGSTLNALTATNASLTFSGSYDGSAARTVGLNLANANTWSGLQTFNYSSSTIYSSFLTASTTNLVVNGQSFTNLLGTGLSNVAGALTIDTTTQNNAINAYIHASTTIPKTYTANTFTALQTFTNSSTSLGSFTYASSTFGNFGTLNLPNLSQGFAYVGSGGKLNTVASSSINLSGFTNDLATLTATNASLTFSGSYNGSTARTVALNLANPNTWSALQTFNYSSSTIYSSFITASSTFAQIGQLTLSTTTVGCLNTNSVGLVYAATCVSGGGIGDPFTHPAAGQSATTSLMLFNGNASSTLFSASTAWFNNFNATSTVATSTISTGGLTVGTSAFVVQQNSGFVAVGTTTPSKPFEVYGNTSGGVARIHRINATTNAVLGTYDVLGESQGTIAKGFGVAQTFSIQGVGGAINAIGTIAGIRENADNTGSLNLYATSLGTGLLGGGYGITISGQTGVNGFGTTTPGNDPLITTAETIETGSTLQYNGLGMISASSSASTRVVGVIRTFAPNAGVAGIPSMQFGTFTNHPLSLYINNLESARFSPSGVFAFGTTTGNYTLSIASSTAPQLALSAGTGLAQWTFRNAGGNFYLSTTTVAGNATTTLAALAIDGTTGGLSLGTTTAGCLNTTTSGLIYAKTCSSGGGTPAGADTNIQYNDGGSTFGGDAGLTWDKTNKLITVTNGADYITTGDSSGDPQIRMFNSGILDLTITALNTANGPALYSNTQIKAPGFLAIDSGLISIAAGSSYSSLGAGTLDLWSPSGSGNFVSFNEKDVSNNGAIGFIAGSNDLLYKSGTENITGGTERLRIKSNGIMGLATSTPLYGLTTYSATAPQFALSAGAGVPQWTFRNAGGALYFATTTTAGTATSSVSSFGVNINGQLLVGSYPTCNGTSNALGITAGVITCDSLVSDARLKKDITPITNGLDVIQALHPKSFYWKDLTNHNTADPRQQYGFIAQEVETILPSAVGQAPDGYKTLDKTVIIPYLVDAVQELATTKGVAVKRSMEENWQDILIGLLILGYIYQQVQIDKLKK